jgi:hypothetical protein
VFLANADRGDNAANDHLIAEMVSRIRAQRESRDGDRDQHPSIPRTHRQCNGHVIVTDRVIPAVQSTGEPSD